MLMSRILIGVKLKPFLTNNFFSCFIVKKCNKLY